MNYKLKELSPKHTITYNQNALLLSMKPRAPVISLNSSRVGVRWEGDSRSGFLTLFDIMSCTGYSCHKYDYSSKFKSCVIKIRQRNGHGFLGFDITLEDAVAVVGPPPPSLEGKQQRCRGLLMMEVFQGQRQSLLHDKQNKRAKLISINTTRDKNARRHVFQSRPRSAVKVSTWHLRPDSIPSTWDLTSENELTFWEFLTWGILSLLV